jgi:SAM-dependent methyltransferase
MARPDPLGQAMLAYQRGEYDRGDLLYRDGDEVQDGLVEEHYFGDPFDPSEFAARRREHVEGPVLDAGCGAGRDAFWFQEHYETLAVDISPGAVQAARERGVENAEVMDMFDLGVADGAFRTVYVTGTQASLSSSLTGLSALLAEFARVTDADGTAVVDMLDPTTDGFADAFGYRPDFRRGMARRTFHFEYREARRASERASNAERRSADHSSGRSPREDGERSDPRAPPRRYSSADDGDDPTEPRPGDTVGPTLDFLLVDPERFREAVAATAWTVADVLWRQGGSAQYALALGK